MSEQTFKYLDVVVCKKGSVLQGILCPLMSEHKRSAYGGFLQSLYVVAFDNVIFKQFHFCLRDLAETTEP